jgi:hypothetical protein
MEYIKKVIQQAVTTGATTGCTNCAVIIPDTGVTYNIKICLVSDSHELGFFNVYDFTGVTGTTLPMTNYVVTGYSSSKLAQIRKYTVSPYVINQYFLSTTPIFNGLDLPRSGLVGLTGVTAFTNYNTYYYVGGITYLQLSGTTGTTVFQFTGTTNDTLNFVNKPMIKDENKENMTGKPIIENDVFIVRQELSVFERNYNLEFIRNLAELESYAGGAYFNIVNNT